MFSRLKKMRRQKAFALAASPAMLVSAATSFIGVYYALKSTGEGPAVVLAGLVAMAILYAPVAEDQGWERARITAVAVSFAFGGWGIASTFVHGDMVAQAAFEAAEAAERRAERREGRAEQTASQADLFARSLADAQSGKRAAEDRLSEAQEILGALEPPAPPPSLPGTEQSIETTSARLACELRGPGEGENSCEGWEGRSVAASRSAMNQYGTQTYAGEGTGTERLNEELEALTAKAQDLRDAHARELEAFDRRAEAAREAVEAAQRGVETQIEAVQSASQAALSAGEMAAQADASTESGAALIDRSVAYTNYINWLFGIDVREARLAEAEAALQALRLKATSERDGGEGAEVSPQEMIEAQNAVAAASDSLTNSKFLLYTFLGYVLQGFVDAMALMFTWAGLLGHKPGQGAVRRPWLGVAGEIAEWRSWLTVGATATIEAKLKRLRRRIRAAEKGLEERDAEISALRSESIPAAEVQAIRTQHAQALSVLEKKHERALAAERAAWEAERQRLMRAMADLNGRALRTDALTLAADGDHEGLRARIRELRESNSVIFEQARNKLSARYMEQINHLEKGNFEALTPQVPFNAMVKLEQEYARAARQSDRLVNGAT